MTLLTLADVATRLACSERTVRREIAADRLTAVRVRGLLRVTQYALQAYIEALPQETPCQFVDCPAGDIRSESASVVAAVSNASYRRAPQKPTPGRSKMHYSAERSMLRSVASQTD